MSWLFTSWGQRTGTSASASALPVNIQDWFPLGLTGLISLQSKGLLRVFSSTMIRKHQFLAHSLLYGPALNIHTWLLEVYFALGQIHIRGPVTHSMVKQRSRLARLQPSAAVPPPSAVTVTAMWKSMCLVVVSDFHIHKAQLSYYLIKSRVQHYDTSLPL